MFRWSWCFFLCSGGVDLHPHRDGFVGRQLVRSFGRIVVVCPSGSLNCCRVQAGRRRRLLRPGQRAEDCKSGSGSAGIVDQTFPESSTGPGCSTCWTTSRMLPEWPLNLFCFDGRTSGILDHLSHPNCCSATLSPIGCAASAERGMRWEICALSRREFAEAQGILVRVPKICYG